MTTKLNTKLDQILPKITSPSFLSSEGIGNEIACYIFDYPAEQELIVRAHITFMLKRLDSHHKQIDVLHLNLFDVVIDYLTKRNLLDKVIEMDRKKGAASTLRGLKGPLSAERIAKHIVSEHQPGQKDLVLISGVGSVWPMLRAHGLLNCLHSSMGTTPLLLFYPGDFDGTGLRLFGKIASAKGSPDKKPYYRAFKLNSGVHHED